MDALRTPFRETGEEGAVQLKEQRGRGKSIKNIFHGRGGKRRYVLETQVTKGPGSGWRNGREKGWGGKANG